MPDQRKLADINLGEKFELFLVVTKSESKLTKNNKPYLDLYLRDKSIELPAKYWDFNPAEADEFTEGKIVKLRGLLEEFSGKPQIKIERMRPTTAEDSVLHEDFLPVSERDLTKMKEELKNHIDDIQNPFLKELINLILSGSNYEKYIRVPAGKAWHHAYIHGLLEHTLEIVRICKLVCEFHPELDKDLMTTAAILHDFGKVEELTFETNFNYTDKGKLVGHIVIAAIEIEKTACSIDNFPTDLKNKLLHLVLSHQGKLEFASPVEPKMPEAIALYQADELSAKTNAYLMATKHSTDKNSRWTNFIRLANTDLYLSEKEDQTGNFKESLFDN